MRKIPIAIVAMLAIPSVAQSQVFPLPSIAALRANPSTGLSGTVIVQGYHVPADRGGGTFDYDPSDGSSVDNGCNIIVDAAGRRWKRQLANGALGTRMCGAKLDLATDDTAAIQRMFDAANNPAGNLIKLDPGQAILRGPVYINHPVKVEGPGSQALDTGLPYAEFVVAFASGNIFNIHHSRANTFRDFSIRKGVDFRTSGADFAVLGDGSTEPVGNIWDGIVTNGSYGVIAMVNGKHWKITNCLFNYGYKDGGVAVYAPNGAFPDSGDNAISNTQFVSATSGSDRGYAAVYLESGIGLMLTGNKFFGGLYGVEVNLKATTANLQISANSFEQQVTAHVDVRQAVADTGTGNITIVGNEFSNLNQVAGGGVVPMEPGISIHQGLSGPYVTNVSIAGNVFNSDYTSAHSEIMINDGRAVSITGNTFHFFGKTNFGAIQTGGYASDVVVGPNAFTQMGTNQHYLQGLSTATKVIGDTLSLADLGAWANGSQVYVIDGRSGSSPCSGGGSGANAFRQNGVWKCF